MYHPTTHAANAELVCYECLNEQNLPDVCEKSGVTEKQTTCPQEVIGCVEDDSEYRMLYNTRKGCYLEKRFCKQFHFSNRQE